MVTVQSIYTYHSEGSFKYLSRRIIIEHERRHHLGQRSGGIVESLRKGLQKLHGRLSLSVAALGRRALVGVGRQALQVVAGYAVA